MKRQKGITLIALVITIIVMLILVAVTVAVAINGGLIGKAEEAKNRTQAQIEKEQLTSAVLGTLNDDGTVNFERLENGNLPAGFTGTNGTYTSSTGNVFRVNADGTVELLQENSGSGSGGEQGQGQGQGGATGTYGSNVTLGTNVSLVAYDDLSQDVKASVDAGNVSAVVAETISGQEIQAVIPTGYTISSNSNENTISQGLVIKDGNNNEFVWIPVPENNMQDSYSYYVEEYNLSNTEPTALENNLESLTGDSQEILTFYYGTKSKKGDPYLTYPEDISDYSNVTDFSYGVHYSEMVTSVNKYGGFYIGRYETTIDSNNSIGSKVNTSILTADKTMKSGINSNISEPYYYRWWGLYYAQRRTNVTGLGKIVQTNMIWGQQWNKMISYFKSHSIDYSATEVETLSTSEEIVNSGQSQYIYNGNTINDVIYNIYDLRGNSWEWSGTAQESDAMRAYRGGVYNSILSADFTSGGMPELTNDDVGSRFTLYIK